MYGMADQTPAEARRDLALWNLNNQDFGRPFGNASAVLVPVEPMQAESPSRSIDRLLPAYAAVRVRRPGR